MSTLLFSSDNIYRAVSNHDWVMIVLLCSIFVYVFSFSYLHRGATLVHYLREEVSVSANHFISWVISSVVFILLLSTLISQYIPILPKIVERNAVLGYTLNKFGFTFLVLLLHYVLKAVFTYFFFQSIGMSKHWPRLYFVAGKFYVVYALLLLLACVVHYYFSMDTVAAFPYYVGIGLFIWILKLLYYIFQNPTLLPHQWYYKILYICTLQIAPILVVYKSLF